MASSDFYIPTTLKTSSVLVDTSGVAEQSTLMYKSSSSKFVATERAIPVGIIRMYPSNSAPTNYIICNGQTLNTFTYRLLHAVMSNKYGGTAYSAGVTDQSGVSTTFTLPNFSNTYLPWASNANTSLANTGLTGLTAVDIDHTHTFPITQTSGSANVNHGHGAGGLQSASHTHTYNTGLQAGGSHSHNIQGNSANHSHLFVRSNSGATATTSNATANHSHGVGAPLSNHSHNTNNSDGHTHVTSVGGNTSNHSSHNYLMTSNAATLNHAHTHNAVTGIYFYVRFQ
jgi:microcystin-dependent protein